MSGEHPLHYAAAPRIKDDGRAISEVKSVIAPIPRKINVKHDSFKMICAFGLLDHSKRTAHLLTRRACVEEPISGLSFQNLRIIRLKDLRATHDQCIYIIAAMHLMKHEPCIGMDIINDAPVQHNRDRHDQKAF